MHWIVDGNNVFGSVPDGWWNDRPAAATRLAQAVARWCRTHDDEVTIVYDPPVAPHTLAVAGGNLTIVEAPRRNRDAADDHIASMVAAAPDARALRVVTSDHGLRARVADATVEGASRFRERIGYGRRPA